jgi:hypothetical protein
MDTQTAISLAARHLQELNGHIFDVLSVERPISPEAAVNLSKIVSKLSPLVGNLIEFNAVEFLNGKPDFAEVGRWRRQDPGFPDAVLDGVTPTPGFEIKAWLPLATEIAARFKDSQNHFANDNTYVCMLAWLPEQLIFGRPRILDVVIVSGMSVAKARDEHYHDPPDYLVLEPEDTSARTKNLQQTNTNGYKWQGTSEQLAKAEQIVISWGEGGRVYQPTPEYQARVRTLRSRFPYRLDTNFAKIDRIVHPAIEHFKEKALGTMVNGMSVAQWKTLFASGNAADIQTAFESNLGIRRASADALLE